MRERIQNSGFRRGGDGRSGNTGMCGNGGQGCDGRACVGGGCSKLWYELDVEYINVILIFTKLHYCNILKIVGQGMKFLSSWMGIEYVDHDRSGDCSGMIVAIGMCRHKSGWRPVSANKRV